MTRKSVLKTTLITALFFLALGGWLLHLRIHSDLNEYYNLIPLLAGLTSVLILPVLFYFKRTLILAYLINGFLVIIGTITMAHFSLVHWQGPLTLTTLFLGTMLPDIILAWGKFVVGKAIFDLEMLHTEADPQPQGRYFRYPNTGWWLVHFVALSVVYALGNVLWK